MVVERTIEGRAVVVEHFHEVKNAAEIAANLAKGKVPAAVIKSSVIVDLFQVWIACQRALAAQRFATMTTRSLHTEILYSLSPSKNIRDSLQKFGINEHDTSFFVVTVDLPAPEREALFASIDGVRGELQEGASFPQHAAAVTKLYAVPESELAFSSLVDCVVARMAAKGL